MRKSLIGGTHKVGEGHDAEESTEKPFPPCLHVTPATAKTRLVKTIFVLTCKDKTMIGGFIREIFPALTTLFVSKCNALLDIVFL